jgi:hypothetical protein
VRITADIPDFPELEFRITDSSGKILSIGKITDNQQIISFGHMPVGSYFLQLIDNENKRDTYKILKQ